MRRLTRFAALVARSGAHCEYPAVKCGSTPLFCYNGGTCTTTASGTTLCACPPSWGGGSCQKLLFSAQAPPAPVAAPTPGKVTVPTWVAAPIIIGVVLLLLLGGCVIYMIVRERRGAPVFQKLEPHDGPSPTRGAELVRTASRADEEVAKVAEVA